MNLLDQRRKTHGLITLILHIYSLLIYIYEPSSFIAYSQRQAKVYIEITKEGLAISITATWIISVRRIHYVK